MRLDNTFTFESDIACDNKMEGYEGSKPLLTDVTVTDPRQLNCDNYADGQMKEYQPGEQAANAEKSKQEKYAVLLPSDESLSVCVFKVLAMESFGRWGKQFREVFKVVVDHHHRNTHQPKAWISAKWRKRLCFALHKTASNELLKRAKKIDTNSQLIREAEDEVDLYRYTHC